MSERHRWCDRVGIFSIFTEARNGHRSLVGYLCSLYIMQSTYSSRPTAGAGCYSHLGVDKSSLASKNSVSLSSDGKSILKNLKFQLQFLIGLDTIILLFMRLEVTKSGEVIQTWVLRCLWLCTIQNRLIWSQSPKYGTTGHVKYEIQQVECPP